MQSIGLGLGIGFPHGSLDVASGDPLALLDPDQALLVDSVAHYTTAQWPGFEHLIADRKYTVGTLRTPRAGRCWLFDGTNDYAGLNDSNLKPTGNYTITGWFKIDWSLSDRGLVGCWNGTGYMLYHFNGAMRAYRDGSSADASLNMHTQGYSNVWTHVSVVLSGTSCTFYVNGSQFGTVKTVASSTQGQPAATPFTIGAYGNVMGFNAGSFRDIRVYNVAKTAAEILAIKNQADTPGTYDTTGLLAGYWCEEESGTTGYDWSGNGRHLTLTNITQASFHAADTGVTYSDANVRGYRLSGSVYIPATSSTLAADGNALTHTGKCPQPGYAPQRVVTGDGSSVYADLGSSLIPASSDFSLELAYYPTGTLSNKGPLTQGNNPGTASRFGLYHLDESTISLLVDHVSGVGTGAVSIAITKDAWSTIRVTKSGSSYTLSVNGTSSSITNTGTITQSTNTQILRYSGCVSGRVSNLKVTTGGTTTYFPLCEGPGSSNTNRDVYYLKSDNTSGVVSSAIVNGTVSTIWSNATDYTSGVFNWSLRYGYTVNGSGVIVPAKLNGASDAAGNAIGQAAGGWASGLQNLNCLPYTNPLGVSVGLETSLDPTAGRKTTSSSKRRRRNTSGRYDRFGARATAMSDSNANSYFGD